MSFRPAINTIFGVLLLVLILFGLCALPVCANELQLALSLYNRQEYDQAKQLLAALRDNGRLDASGFALLAMCHLNTQEIDAARQAITMARRLDPSDYLVRLSGGNLQLHLSNYPQAATLFDELYKEYPHRSETQQGLIQALVGLSLEAFRDGNFETALKEIERALSLQPDNSDLISYKISVLRHTNRSEELEQTYRRYLELRPASADAHAGLGDLLKSRGKLAAAGEHFVKAVRYDSADPQPFLFLGRQSAAAGETDRARSLIQEAVGKAVQMFNNYRMQAAQEMEAGGREDPARLQRVKSLSEQSERPKRLLEESLSVLIGLYSEPEHLLAELQRLAEWYSSSTDVRTVLAEQLMAADYVARAKAEWEELIEQYPYYSRAQLGLAECHRRQGRLTKAALAGRRALDLEPEDPAVYRCLEKIYRQMGKPDVYLQVLEMQILKNKYNILLYEEAALAAESVDKPRQADLFRERAQMLRDYRKQHR